MNNYLILPNFLDKEKYRKYFMHEFLSKNDFQAKVQKIPYAQFRQNESFDPIIDLLDKEISTRIPFLRLEYISIFKHTCTQPIHIDGNKQIRSCSLNLTLQGYKNTRLNFYRLKENKLPIPTNAFYFETNEVEYIESLEENDEWVLVNSGCPHNIDSVNSEDPRYTLCIRFYGNPKFENIVSWLTTHKINQLK